MGLGHERFDPALGAWASDSGFSESNHRQFYRRWAQLMSGGQLGRRAAQQRMAGAGHAGDE